jgi:hypothetical protein
MEKLVESIRIALAASASGNERAEGAEACRKILAALDPKREPTTTRVAFSIPLVTAVRP